MNKTDFIKELESEVNTNKIVDFVIALCSEKTINPPGNEHLSEPHIKKYVEQIPRIKNEVHEKQKGRPNIIVTVTGNRPGPTVAIVSHTDVVPVEGQKWETDPFTPTIKDERIIARGAADNKGPLASVTEGVRAFCNIMGTNFAGDIKLIYVSDEETASDFGVKYLFSELGINCDYALIPDGGEKSQLIFGEMGIYTLEVSTKGKSYHGSMPEHGVNAIVPVCDLITRLGNYAWEGLSGDAKFDNSVLNIGLLEGGTAMNTVPDHASTVLMWRYPLGVEIEDIHNVVEEKIREVSAKYPKVKFNTKVLHKSLPYIGNEDGKLVAKSVESYEDLGFDLPKIKTIRAETVAKYIFEPTGAQVIVNGPEDGSSAFMHNPNESISIKSLTEFAKYYAVLMYNLLCVE